MNTHRPTNRCRSLSDHIFLMNDRGILLQEWLDDTFQHLCQQEIHNVLITTLLDRVETNPHQTLTRLNNNIVFLSRPKVGFNPAVYSCYLPRCV